MDLSKKFDRASMLLRRSVFACSIAYGASAGRPTSGYKRRDGRVAKGGMSRVSDVILRCIGISAV